MGSNPTAPTIPAGARVGLADTGIAEHRPMPRKPDPERIDLARRFAARSRLTGEGLSEERADAWLAAWEESSEAATIERYASSFWEAGIAWIARERTTRPAPAANRAPPPR